MKFFKNNSNGIKEKQRTLNMLVLCQIMKKNDQKCSNFLPKMWINILIIIMKEKKLKIQIQFAFSNTKLFFFLLIVFLGLMKLFYGRTDTKNYYFFHK